MRSPDRNGATSTEAGEGKTDLPAERSRDSVGRVSWEGKAMNSDTRGGNHD